MPRVQTTCTNYRYKLCVQTMCTNYAYKLHAQFQEGEYGHMQLRTTLGDYTLGHPLKYSTNQDTGQVFNALNLVKKIKFSDQYLNL